MPETPPRLAVVGVGLIGGSIALAARNRLRAEVVGVVRSDESARRAVDAGVVAAATTDLGRAVAEADLVVVCTPVGDIAQHTLAAAAKCRPGALLTDAGSTKAAIVDAVESGLSGFADPPAFVGSHPLAGDHRTGPESARVDLLEGKTIVVTPTEWSRPEAIERVTEFWRSLGTEVIAIPPREHDAALARTSHLPHVAAAALAAATPEGALPLTATGWRDTTRVAAAAPELWRDILLDNRDEIVAALSDVEGRLAGFRQAIAAGDAETIQQLLEQGRTRRDAVGD